MAEAALKARQQTPVVQQATGEVVQFSAPSTLLEIIARAAADPSVDIDKFERLLNMSERIKATDAEQAYNIAMNEAQGECEPIRANLRNSSTNSRYASYPALDRAVRPIYIRHGFSLSYDSGEGAPVGHVRVRCIVGHRQGFSRVHHVDIPADGKGAKGGDVMTLTHAAGSAFSYGQRYLLKLIFNLAVDSDDDGNKAGSSVKPTPLAQQVIAGINAATSADELRTWKQGHFAEVSKKVSATERQTIIELFNRRIASFRPQSQGAAQ